MTGLLFVRYPDNTGPHVGHLWDSSGNMLAEATLASTGDAFPYIRFAHPVPILAGFEYTVSYYTPTGHYASSEFYFPPIGGRWWPMGPSYHQYGDGYTWDYGAGVYHYGEGGGWPNQSWHNSNYWVDPVFTTS